MTIVWNPTPEPPNDRDHLKQQARWIATANGTKRKVTFSQNVLDDQGLQTCQAKAEQKIRAGKKLHVSNEDFPPPPQGLP